MVRYIQADKVSMMIVMGDGRWYVLFIVPNRDDGEINTIEAGTTRRGETRERGEEILRRRFSPLLINNILLL